MSARDDLIMAFDADVEIVKSGGGVFEVTVDDRLVFSKKALGRFPEPGELASLAAPGQGEQPGPAGAAPEADGECCPPDAACREERPA